MTTRLLYERETETAGLAQGGLRGHKRRAPGLAAPHAQCCGGRQPFVNPALTTFE
jgi:hypothetical protein